VYCTGIVELRADLSALCLKAGLKKLPTVLLVTDAQLVDETLLIENVVSAVRNEVSNYISTNPNYY